MEIKKLNKHKALKSKKLLPYPFIKAHYADTTWTLHTPKPGASSEYEVIHWKLDTKLINIDSIPSQTKLINDSKYLLLAARFNTADGRSVPTARTLAGVAHNLKSISMWILSEGYDNYGHITPNNVNRFINFLRTRYESKHHKELTKNTIAKYLITVQDIFLYSEYLQNSPKIDPLGGSNGYAYMGVTSTDSEAHPATPNEIAIPLVARSIGLIESVAPRVLADLRILDRNKNPNLKTYVPERMQKRQWISPDGHIILLETKTIGDIRTLLAYCITACIVVILYFSAMRISELLGLKAGCCRTVKASGKLPSYCRINGKIIKRKEDARESTHETTHGEDHVWIAPTDVKLATSFMTDVSKPFRTTNNTKYIWNIGRFEIGNTVYTPSNIKLLSRQRVNIWINSLVQFAEIENEKNWIVQTSQARKTYAKFARLRDKTNLHAIAYQFGHVGRLVTEMGYTHFDTDLSKELEAEDYKNISNMWSEIQKSKHISGLASHKVKEQIIQFQGGYTKLDPDSYVKYMRDADVIVIPCDWGFCLYEQSSSKCKGSNNNPNKMNKEPFLCSGCSNLLVTDEQFPFWEKMREENVEFHEKCPQDSQESKLAEARQSRIESILNRIEYEE